MDWFLRRIDIVSEDRFFILFLKAYRVSVRIVRYCYDVSRLELKSLMLAVELHLVTIPRIAIHTDQIVTMVGVSIAEIKIDRFNAV